jgi:hypothetical protein
MQSCGERRADRRESNVADAIVASDQRRMSKGVVRRATARLPRDA